MELTWDWKIQSGTNSCCTIMPWQSDHKLNIDHLKQCFFSYHICRSRLSLIIHQNNLLVVNYQSSHRIGRPFCVLFLDMSYRNNPTSWRVWFEIWWTILCHVILISVCITYLKNILNELPIIISFQLSWYKLHVVWALSKGSARIINDSDSILYFK